MSSQKPSLPTGYKIPKIPKDEINNPFFMRQTKNPYVERDIQKLQEKREIEHRNEMRKLRQEVHVLSNELEKLVDCGYTC